MARFAIRAQAALVHVLPVMAGDALLFRIPKPGIRVTFRAGHLQVLAGESESRAPVIEIRTFPGRFLMAALALRPLLIGMLVVLAVAGDALRFELVAEGSIQVTGFARNRRVASQQGVARVARMIEGRGLPCRLPMAGFATHPEGAAMHVFLCVATVALGRCLVYVQASGVAGVALDAAMGISQLVARVPLMVEPDFLPRFLRMAGFALAAKALLVHIVLLMAVAANSRRFVVECLAFVARKAAGTGVRTEQRKMRTTVIERRFLPATIVMAPGAIAT